MAVSNPFQSVCRRPPRTNVSTRFAPAPDGACHDEGRSLSRRRGTFEVDRRSQPNRVRLAQRRRRRTLLRAGGCLLVEIASVLGFASQSHFSCVFRKVTGMSPGRFRQDVALSKIPQSRLRSRRFLAENRLVMRVDQPIAAIFFSDIKSVPHRHDLKASLILLSDHELTRTTGRSDRAGNHVWAF